MSGLKRDRARERARDLLATYFPAPDGADALPLRALVTDYFQTAERQEAEARGHAVESDELISAAFDALARDFFKRSMLRAVSRKHGR
jgi:hypothetical protein